MMASSHTASFSWLASQNNTYLSLEQQERHAICLIKLTSIATCEPEVQRFLLIGMFYDLFEKLWSQVSNIISFTDTFMRKVADYTFPFEFDMASGHISSFDVSVNKVRIVVKTPNGIVTNCNHELSLSKQIGLLTSPLMNITGETKINGGSPMMIFKSYRVTWKYPKLLDDNQEFFLNQTFDFVENAQLKRDW